MFTGIIEHVGRIESLNGALDGGSQTARLRVHAGLAASLAISGSIAGANGTTRLLNGLVVD